MLAVFKLKVVSAGSTAAELINLYTGVVAVLAGQPPAVLIGTTLILPAPPPAVIVVTLKDAVPAVLNEVTGDNVPAPRNRSVPTVNGVAIVTLPLPPLVSVFAAALAIEMLLIVPVPSMVPLVS